MRRSLPRPSNCTFAVWPSRAILAVPIAAQAFSVPAKPRSALAPITAAGGVLLVVDVAAAPPQRNPRAFTAKRNAALPASVKSARPRNVVVPSNTRSASGCTSRIWFSTRTFDGRIVAVKSPCVTLPRRVALPPLPSASNCSASGVSLGGLPEAVSRPMSSASALACTCQRGLFLPRSVRLARTGPGAAPDSATSMRERSPRATKPSRAGVRPAAVGSTAVAVRSVRKSSRGA